MPTNQDRKLWRKASEIPNQITEEERRRILGHADRGTPVTNAFKVSGSTPKYLENKALANLETFTEAEFHLI